MPFVFGIDETIERRWGEKINVRGIYRDPVRSSYSHFVRASSLRWMCLMWLGEISWALTFFTVLALSEHYYIFILMKVANHNDLFVRK